MILKSILWMTFIILAWSETCAAAGQKYVVCYHGAWSAFRKSSGKFDVGRDIDPFLCTHLIYAFFGITESGEVRILDRFLDLTEGKGNIRKFNLLKLKNPRLKTLASVGGWNHGSKEFSIVAADPVKRARFAQSAVQFLKTHSFDGIDIDWEYPNQRHKLKNDDKTNFVLMLKDLKAALAPHRFILTAAVSAAEFSAQISYSIPKMVKYLDLINVKSFDLRGPWDPVVGHNAPMYVGPADTTYMWEQMNVDAIVKYWLSQGAPRNKLVIGVPFFGHSFILKDQKKHKIGAPQIGKGLAGPYSINPGDIGYNELCEKFKKERTFWHHKWDNTQKAPYAYSGRNWISYDNPKSIRIKAEYVVRQQLAGIMAWSIEFDDFRGNCRSKRYPLLSKINDVFNKQRTG